MRRVRFLLLFLLSGAIAALVGGFLAATVIASLVIILEVGPVGLLVVPVTGFLGAVMALKVATLPAALLGGLLWCRRVRGTAAWAGTGAIAGLLCYSLLWLQPGVDPILAFAVGDDWLLFAPAFALAGIPAALIFRLMMGAFTAFDDAGAAD